MAFKINIGTKEGITFRFETESEALIGKKLGETIAGEELLPDLEGYVFEIRGASDKAGFPAKADVEGTGLKRVLLSYGWGMKQTKPKGLRRRKTVRGNTISQDIVQVNLVIVKEGKKKLSEIFPDQVKKEKQERAGGDEQEGQEAGGQADQQKEQAGESGAEQGVQGEATGPKPEEKKGESEKSEGGDAE